MDAYRAGQIWIEALIERLLGEQGMSLDAPITWTPNMDHEEFIMEAKMLGVPKRHKLSYEDVEDVVADSTVQRRIETFLKTYFIPDKPDAGLTPVGNLPEPIHSAPVDLAHHWSILDQTKAEMRKEGRPGIVLLDKESAAYKGRVAAFLAQYGFRWEAKRPYLVIQHDTQSKVLFEAAKKAGLDVELI